LKNKQPIEKLPRNFEAEEKLLKEKGFNSWSSIMNIKDQEINDLVQNGLGSIRNLKRLRCIAIFINEINLSLGDAALLMHSGIPSIEALAILSPQELLHKTGRLERLLNSGRTPVVNLKTANVWIEKAKKRHSTHCNINYS
tara:strand:- start:1130 stop:1552 length:423 start_codon:yes stop_codon:yes gene_type:complete